jgi:multidrug efflux pump subunit AcrB
LGESAPPFYYNIISRRKNSPNYGQAIVTLDSNRSSLELIREIQTELDSRFPTARLLVRQLEQGPPFDAPVEVRLFGSDLEQLKQFGEILRAVASRIPDVLHTRTALSDTRPVASIDVSAERANWVGLSEPQIADQLYARLEGLPAGAVIEGVEEVPVRVRVDQEHRHRVEELEDASLFVSSSRISADNSDGSTSEPILRAIPVASIADIHLDPQRAVITRYNGRRVNEVQAFITAGKLPSDILHQLEQRIAASDFELPSGFSLEIGGEASERNAAVGRLMANVSVLAVGIVASLVLALRSFRQTALIGLVAMLSIGLGLGALWLFNYPFGFMAIVGTMGLVGIAINDSIVVVSALASNPRVRAGDAQALVDTVIEVSRHVLATTATTVVGFLPLLLSGGGFWPPLAIAVGAGVTGATLISLTLVPCAFCWMVRARPYLEIPGSGVRTSAG